MSLSLWAPNMTSVEENFLPRLHKMPNGTGYAGAMCQGSHEARTEGKCGNVSQGCHQVVDGVVYFL